MPDRTYNLARDIWIYSVTQHVSRAVSYLLLIGSGLFCLEDQATSTLPFSGD